MALAHQPPNILRIFVESFSVPPLGRLIVIPLTCRHFLLLPGHFREIPGRLSQIPGHFFQNVLNPVLREILQVELSDLSAQRIQFTGHSVALAGHGPGGGRRFSKLDGEKKRGCRILDLILGGPFPGLRRRFREPIAQHCGTKQKAPRPGLHNRSRGLLLMQQGSAYRLTWRLVPPPGAPVPLSPLETTLTQSASLSL